MKVKSLTLVEVCVWLERVSTNDLLDVFLSCHSVGLNDLARNCDTESALAIDGLQNRIRDEIHHRVRFAHEPGDPDTTYRTRTAFDTVRELSAPFRPQPASRTRKGK